MGWLSGSMIGLGLLVHPGVTLPAAARAGTTPVAAGPGAVVADCDDFVRVTPTIFTGRTGAWFSANGQREYLSQDTFGPGVLRIGGVDAAVWLAGACRPR